MIWIQEDVDFHLFFLDLDGLFVCILGLLWEPKVCGLRYWSMQMSQKDLQIGRGRMFLVLFEVSIGVKSKGLDRYIDGRWHGSAHWIYFSEFGRWSGRKKIHFPYVMMLSLEVEYSYQRGHQQAIWLLFFLSSTLVCVWMW